MVIAQANAHPKPHMVIKAHVFVFIFKKTNKISKTMIVKLIINIGDNAIISYYSPTRSAVIFCCV